MQTQNPQPTSETMNEPTKLTLSGPGMQLLQNEIADRLQTAKEPMTALQLANGNTKAVTTYWRALCMLEGKGVVESNVTLTGAITWRLL